MGAALAAKGPGRSDELVSLKRFQPLGFERFAQGLAVSCNPCFIQIGARLGKENFCNYFEAFGLREGTGIDLPGEIRRSEYYTADQMGPVQSFGL